MTMQAVQEFYKAGSKNQQLIVKLAKDAKGPEDFIKNAVAEGKQQGFDFSYEEADQFVKNMQGGVAKKAGGGALSDLELEAVAGGKETSTGGGYGDTTTETTEPYTFRVFTPEADAIFKDIGDWFSKW